jgi:hypothetical protein
MFDSEIAPSADAEETQNPLGQSTDSQNADGAAAVFGSVKKLQLVPESRDAEDGHEVEQTVDFFDILAEALVVGKQLDPDRIQEGMKECFDDIPDHEATMDAGEFCKVVEEHLDLDLEDSDRAQLVAQVQGVKSAESTQEQDPVSVADFERWWDSFFETEMVDPFRAAVAEMEKSGVISPNSNFRGNWDLVQAVLLFYIAAMLPYRIGFSHDVVLWSAWFWLDLSIDIYFIFDLCLNFKTAVITSDGELLYKKPDIGEWACLRALRDHLQQKTAALGVALALTVSRGARSEILRQGMAAGGLRQLPALRLHPLRPRRGRGRGRKQGNAYAEDVSLAEAASPGSDQADSGSVGGGDVWRAATQDWQNRLRGRCNGALGSLRLVLGWCGHHTRRREFLHAAEWRHDRWLGGA